MTELVSATIIQKLAAAVAPSLIEPSKGLAQKTKDTLEVRFGRGFSKYITDQVERYSTVKTIISSNIPIPLMNIYVNLYLHGNDTGMRDDDLLTFISSGRAVLFTATAGSGKSMLMRYLFLRFLETQNSRIPIFIDLRDLNHAPERVFLDFLQARLQENIQSFSRNHLNYALHSGKVILFLDGYDEIDYDKRQARESEINQLVNRFPKLLIFVSSRPADNFASWTKFHVFQVQPFTKKQVELLIDKVEYDDDSKKLFRKKLTEGLYEKHGGFLANPLLTTMMLITLAQYAEVPAKIYLFYEYAFEALFGKHDATKEGRFERKRHTSLALDDFKRLFSYFCTISYINKTFDFSQDAVLNLIDKSIKASQISTDKNAYQRDLVESTCVLVRNGLDYTFSHRSFQEYFVAYFVSRVKISDFEKFIPILVERAVFDNVLRCYQK